MSELDAANNAVVTHTYNGFGQLISTKTAKNSIRYAYNAQGIRTAQFVNGSALTEYLLDGGNVVAEAANHYITAVYTRGTNLISGTNSLGSTYYLYNAHGDVVQLTNANGVVTRAYDYDAFGNEKNPSSTDTNPFRYCGEYYDAKTGLYYLRARYYDPTVGRFTQEDTHWNTANMIYGDTPQKINEREDALGLKTYSYAPQISAVMQSGNLYVYATSNPLKYHDPSGAAGELTLTWTSSMWWLVAVDGILPVGDIIYATGIAIAAIGDTISYVGVDNIVHIVSDLPDTVRNTFNGGGANIPPDPNWGEGFRTFGQLKRYLGSPGEGNQWHHIVEQCQGKSSRAGFHSNMIQNTKNVVSIPKELHQSISNFYSSIPRQDVINTGGKVFRDWLTSMSFQEQYEWGLRVLRLYGVNI